MLNNLFKVCWKWKNADIFCYKLTSLVSLLQGNVKKNPKKSMKIANIYREILHIFWTIWGIRLEFSGKMWLVITLSHKKPRFHPVFGEIKLSNWPPSPFRVNVFDSFILVKSIYSYFLFHLEHAFKHMNH